MTVQQTFAFSDIILLSPRAIIKVPELQVYFRYWKEKRDICIRLLQFIKQITL